MKKITTRIAAAVILFMFTPFFGVNSVKADDTVSQVNTEELKTGTVINVTALGVLGIYLIQDQETGLIYSYENIGMDMHVGDIVTFTPLPWGKIRVISIVRTK